jgi:hypothetical protein
MMKSDSNGAGRFAPGQWAHLPPPFLSLKDVRSAGSRGQVVPMMQTGVQQAEEFDRWLMARWVDAVSNLAETKLDWDGKCASRVPVHIPTSFPTFNILAANDQRMRLPAWLAHFCVTCRQ